MRKRLVSLIVAAIVVGAAGGAASSASALVPREGHYTGHGPHDTRVSFHYSSAHGMTHFTLDHHWKLGGAQVLHGVWHETCHNGACTAGTWLHNSRVDGYYMFTKNHTKHHWTAHWVPPVG